MASVVSGVPLLDAVWGAWEAEEDLVAVSAADAELRRLIEEIVSDVFGIDPGDMRKPTRGRAKIALARQVAMYLAHVACGMNLTDVGRLFGRDRTTVAHACNVVEVKRDDVDFDDAVVLLELMLRAMHGAVTLTRGAAQMASSDLHRGRLT